MNLLSDPNFWRELITVLAFGLFIGISIWAYRAGRKPDFKRACARILLDDDKPKGKEH